MYKVEITGLFNIRAWVPLAANSNWRNAPIPAETVVEYRDSLGVRRLLFQHEIAAQAFADWRKAQNPDRGYRVVEDITEYRPV